jgi:MFS family permease
MTVERAERAPRRVRLIPPLLLENGDFRRFWTGQTVSLFGDQVTLIALPLTAVLVLHADAAQMGFLTAAELVPNLLFSLHAGAWIDRRGRRRRTMIASDLGRAALLGVVPLAYVLDVLALWQLYVVAFLAGTLSVLFFVSYSTLFVALVPRERFVEANSLLHGSRAFSFVSGPSAGGFLVQLFSAPFAVLADAGSFLVSALCLQRTAAVEPPTEEATRGHLAAGIRFIRDSAILRASLLATATINFFNFVFFALFILYATRSLGVRPATLGVVLGSASVGGLIGSALTGRLGRRIGIGPSYIVGCVLFPAPLVLVPLAGGPQPLVVALLFLAEFFSGLGVMILDISAGSIIAAAVPDRLRARASAAYRVVNYGIRPIGSLVGGALGSTIGLRTTLWIATVGGIAGFLWLLPSPIARMRELPEVPE